MYSGVVQHVFLVGAKSLGAYGGYETFIDKLTEYHAHCESIQYHVACKANGEGAMNPYQTEGANIISENEFIYHNARCFRINIPERLGPAQAIYYDIASLKKCCQIIKEEKIKNPIIYIMACRIGPFAKYFYKKIHGLGGVVYVNPDGHEWKRAKWTAPIRKYWKISEKLMVKYCDLVVCDSVNIEKYIHQCYDGKGAQAQNPKTTFIAYGADIKKSTLTDESPKYVDWMKKNELKPNQYYLVVGRFVPENNYEVMIREYMCSKTNKDFVLVTNVNDKFLTELENKLGFEKDKRIKFVGTVYDKELLKKIRENAYGYLHGHEVGGTNPSLLEALGSTKLNLLLDVPFNREVAEEAAVYWEKETGCLKKIIEKMDGMSSLEIEKLEHKAKKRISEQYSWSYIEEQYNNLWLRRKN